VDGFGFLQLCWMNFHEVIGSVEFPGEIAANLLYHAARMRQSCLASLPLQQ